MGGTFSRKFVVPEGATLWRYAPENGAPLNIREAADVDAEGSGILLMPEEVFWVSEELVEEGSGVLYLRLADGRGWAFDRKPDAGVMCVREPTPRAALDEALARVAARRGAASVASRHFRLPRRAEDDYAVSRHEVLGTGVNGEVCLGRCRRTGRKVAVKRLSLAGATASERRAAVLELELAMLVDHEHVVQLLGAYETEEQLTLVFEHLAGGELFERAADGPLPEAEAAEVVRQMLQAVRYLHEEGFAHRDVKLENFVFEREGAARAKLIDFGLAAVCGEGAGLVERCGTPAYAAPEVLEGHYGRGCDLWAVGVAAYALLVGQLPFDGESDEEMLRNVKAGRCSFAGRRWDDVSADAICFVRQLLEPRPEARPSAEQALRHPWLAAGEPEGPQERCRSRLSTWSAELSPTASTASALSSLAPAPSAASDVSSHDLADEGADAGGREPELVATGQGGRLSVALRELLGRLASCPRRCREASQLEGLLALGTF